MDKSNSNLFGCRQFAVFLFVCMAPLLSFASTLEEQSFPIRLSSIVEGLRVRSKPDLSSRPIDRLAKGEYVMAISTSSSPTKVDGKDAPWYKTVTQRRTVGWVLGAYLKVDPSVPVKLTEQELIAQFPSLVKRDGGVLSLTLADGQIKKLDNVPSPPEGGGGINYHFEDYFRDTNQFLIHWGDGWESAGFYFVDQRTGVQTQLEGKPIFSPNKRKILSIGYNPTSDDVLHIWIGRIHSGEIFNDFKDDSLSYILRGGFWLDDSTIAILGDPMDANNNVLIFLRYIGKQWVLEKMELK